MKAVLCKEFGPPDTLVVEDVPSLHPGDGQVLIDVKACGVNHPVAYLHILDAGSDFLNASGNLAAG